jgi:hypothetical protein
MFETMLDQLVKVTLTNEPVKTEVVGGTLFVSPITESQARTVHHRLSTTFGLGRVQTSAIGDTGEYAFDFVATPVEELSPFATVNS